MDSGLGFGVNDRDRRFPQKSQRHESVFRVGEAIVLDGQGGAGEHRFRIPEIESMAGQVVAALALVPCESKMHKVYTVEALRNYRSSGLTTPRPPRLSTWV